jgi:hypothetical protein
MPIRTVSVGNYSELDRFSGALTPKSLSRLPFLNIGQTGHRKQAIFSGEPKRLWQRQAVEHRDRQLPEPVGQELHSVSCTPARAIDVAASASMTWPLRPRERWQADVRHRHVRIAIDTERVITYRPRGRRSRREVDTPDPL